MAESQMEPVSVEPYDDGNPDHSKIVRTSFAYVSEARNARWERMELNRRNYDVYHMRQDYGHKRVGQSREFLPKQQMATEQITQFFQQGVMEVRDWFGVEYSPGINPEMAQVKKEDVRLLVDRQLTKNNFGQFVGDSIKSGLLGSLMVCKVSGKYVKSPFYVAEQKFNADSLKIESKLKRGERKNWQLDLVLVSPEDYFVDPSGKKLYEMHQAYLDYHEVKALSEGKNAIYDPKIVDQVPLDMATDYQKKLDDQRRTGQNQPYVDYRKKVKLQEFWGNILDETTGELLHENVVWTVANDRYLIQPPKKNPYWHGKSPFVSCPLIWVPGSVWHRAFMDGATRHNIALNELYNLMVDAGMMATYGLKQYRPDWIEDEEAYSEGFYPGQSVPVNAACPPGMKAIERVDSSSMSQESMAMFNIMNSELSQSALTNDLRMGALPQRAVKATEVVESSQSITSVLSGMTKLVEDMYIEKIVSLSWMNTLQHMDDLNHPEVQALLGPERAIALSAMSPAERFAESVGKVAFQVFGVSKVLSKMKDFRKLTAFLQTVSGSPVLIQEFMQKYDMGRLLAELLGSLDINTERLKNSPEEQEAAKARVMQAVQQANQNNQGGRSQDGMTADQSQIPQAGGANMGSMNENPTAGHFPPQALSAMGR